MSRLKNAIVNNTAVHNWLILFFDTIIGSFSILLAGYLVRLAQFPTGALPLRYQLLLVTLTYALFFLYFKTGEAIPKRSGFKNVLRSLDALSGAFIALMLLNLVVKMSGREPLVSNVEIIINAIISVFLIGGYRFVAALFTRHDAGSSALNSNGQVFKKNENDIVFQRHSAAVIQLLKSKTILITGAAGSIGSRLAQQAAAYSRVQIICLDINETSLYELEYRLSKLHPAAKLVFVLGDIRDGAAMEKLFEQYQPQVVIHAAAYKHVPMLEAQPCEAVRNNIHGTKVLTDLSLKYKAERFLLLSTDKAGKPGNVMSASKRIAEMYIQATVKAYNNSKDTKFIIARFGNVTGSGGSVISRFKMQIETGGPVTITHPDISRYFITISEACSLLLEALTMGNGNEVYRFDMGKPVKIVDIANELILQAQLKPGVDIKVLYTGLRNGEKLHEEQHNEKEETPSPNIKKILITNVVLADCDNTRNDILKLIQVAAENNKEAVLKQMNLMVQEFINTNSVFEATDKDNNVVTASY